MHSHVIDERRKRKKEGYLDPCQKVTPGENFKINDQGYCFKGNNEGADDDYDDDAKIAETLPLLYRLIARERGFG